MVTRTEHETNSRERLGSLIGLVRQTTGLDENQAKTVVYYATATYALLKLDRFPILAIYGPLGTGKSTLLEILQQIAYDTPDELLSAAKVSGPVIRDKLKDGGTALIEEADGMDEQWFIKRYAKASAYMTVNRPMFSSKEEAVLGYLPKQINLFGATVLHRRKPFKDPAVLSRSIVIKTRYQEGGVLPLDPGSFQPYAKPLEAIALELDWETEKANAQDRILDTWQPLLLVANHIADSNWCTYANGQMGKARTELTQGQEEEPSQAVFSALLTVSLTDDFERLEDPQDRVLLSKVAEELQKRGMNLTSWQVGQILRDLGFETKKVGGRQVVLTGGTEYLIAVGKALGIEDEWLEEAGNADAAE